MPITLNQSSLKSDADKYLDLWKKLWSVRDTAWHLNHRHPFWEQGHQVIGVECADQAINDFFSSNNIPFVSSPLNQTNEGQVFETVDTKLKVIQTNFLTLECALLNSKIDAVWDRGSFGTITYEEQVLYIQTIKKLLAPGFRYLLLVLEFDEQIFLGPPFSISEKRVHQMFGEFCAIEKLESTLPQHLQLYQKHMKQELEVRETVYLLKDKHLLQTTADDNNNISD